MSRNEIDAINRRFEDAVRRQDAGALASLYTADAVALPPDGPFVTGRESIKQLWQSVITQMGLKDVTLSTIDMEVVGDKAYEVGEAALTLGSGSATVKFVVVWKRVDRQWRLHRDIWNGKGV